jgi:7-cyano-7-deazaguanine reductase
MAKPPQLGRPVRVPASPRDAVLDRVSNPHPDSNYVARFTFPEFTAICPITGQPDFATLVIDYVPGRWLVESKSLKLYLSSFRNHGVFHEDCTVAIGKRLVALLRPKWLRIGGYFHPRGGMPIDVFWQAGKLPRGRRIRASPPIARAASEGIQRPVPCPLNTILASFLWDDICEGLP